MAPYRLLRRTEVFNKRTVLQFMLVTAFLGTGLAGGCGDSGNSVTFAGIVSNPALYDGNTVTFDAFYFSGFEISALSESIRTPTDGGWRIVPSGTLIWVKQGPPAEVYERLYVETDNPTGYPQRVGKLRVTGKFETGGPYGHLDAYKHQIEITDAELLEWTPPPR
jgi:hypothetical protein